MLRNILAVIVGVVLGSVVNGVLISVGPMVVPPPEGADVTTYEGLKASMHLFQPQHFVFPFLAHALGTLIGAMIAALIAASRKLYIAMGIGVIFLLGGITNAVLLPVPMWYTALDLVVAYLPMAWIGAKLGGARKG